VAFDDGRLDDEAVLARFDLMLRQQAEAGARVRREAIAAEPAIADAVEALGDARPRAVLAAGPDSRLLRAVLEPFCPVPFVAWPSPHLPAWVGNLDLVVVLAPQGDDVDSARAVAEAVRRGTPVVVACPERSLVAEHAVGRHATILPTTTGDHLATAVAMLELLDRLSLGPQASPDVVAAALDEVAVSCSPHRDLAVNPAKGLAIGLAETSPLLWGGTVLAARAARRVAEALRRATGRAVLAADAEHLFPIIEAAEPADVFADPFAEPGGDLRPSLVVLDDGFGDEVATATRQRLVEAAEARGVRVELITSAADGDVARYAALLATGTYAAAYLRIGQT
jgi:hypothetical protein